MSIHRRLNYSAFSNEGAQDSHLSWEAKGFLWFFLTDPTKQDIDAVEKENPELFRSIFEELKDSGFVVVSQEDDGTECRWIFDSTRDSTEWTERRRQAFELIGDSIGWVSERNARTEQLAEVPKPCIPGFVYLVAAIGTSRYKIGLTTNIDRRLKSLTSQQSFPLSLVHSFFTSNCFASELELHQRFSHKRVHGKWFELDVNDIAEIKAIGDAE